MEAFFNNKFLFGEDILNQIHLFCGPWLDFLMINVTALGNETFYVSIIPLLYWCYDKTFAARLGGAFLVSTFFNDILKFLFQNPRPDPDKLLAGIRELNIEYKPVNTPGFPSGHAQDSISFWGALSYFLRSRYILLISITLILLISYSRLYLAVHFMGDVLGGLCIGGIILIIYIISIAWIEKKYDLLNKTALIMLLLVLPYLLFKLLPGYYLVKIMGISSGFTIGMILEKEKIGFNSRAKLYQNLLKLLIGFSGVVLILIGTKFLFPKIPSAGFLRYWLLGIWITFFAPYLFSRVKGLQINI